MKIQVLDHGYVEFIEAWGQGKEGDDTRVEREHGEAYVHRDTDFEVGIIEAARQSTQGNFRGWAEDRRLLKYLHDNKHGTPFEFAGMVIEVQAPIFVFREWHRHRTQSYNEMSARYAPLPDLYYQPTRETVLERGRKSTSNKQAGGVTEFNSYYVDAFLANVEQIYSQAEEVYQAALANGMPKELARVVMPVGHYSRMRATANLRNWLAFLTLRADPAAQWEIRQFANAVAQIIEATFPETYALFRARP